MRPDLVTDCSRCAALCCVELAFDASPSFAIDKPAGVACPHLSSAHRCSIHDDLRERGFGGCVAFDCHGAGPRAMLATTSPKDRTLVFGVLRVIHEQLWLLAEAAKLPAAASLVNELGAAAEALTRAADAPAEVLLTTDLRPHKERARLALRRVGALHKGRLTVVG